MNFKPLKKDDVSEFLTDAFEEHIKDSNVDRKVPEFDEFGTALNDI